MRNNDVDQNRQEGRRCCLYKESKLFFLQYLTGPYYTGFNDGGGKAPKFQNFPKIIRVSLYLFENRDLRFRGDMAP